MVTVSGQATIPFLKVNDTIRTEREGAVGTDSFLSFLDKSLNKPFQALKSSAKAGESASKPPHPARSAAEPLQSARSLAKEDGRNKGVATPEGNAAVQSQQTKETRPGEADAVKSDAGTETESKAVEGAAEEKAEDNQGQNPEDSKDLSSDADLTQKCDMLLAIMDKIIQTLQRAADRSQALKEDSSGALPVMSSKPAEMLAVDELQKMLSDLVKAAGQLEGTKTAEHALAFAKKLQQLLGDDSIQALADGLELSAGKENSLESLVGKMLHEAENTKMHLVQASLQEITIPAMKAEAPQAPPAAEVPDENEEATAQAQVHEEKNFIPENPENRASSDPENGGVPERPQLAKARGKETENAADLRQNTLTDAALNLKEPQNDTAIARPERMKTFLRADVTKQIVEKAETMLREDKTEMILQLKPESLGKISLKVIHERGEIIARFVAESEQVKAVLEGNMQLLKDSLQKSGVAVQSLEVSVGQQGGNPQRGWDSKPNEGFAHSELKASGGLKKSFTQPTYRYGGFEAGYYLGQSSEIDLTA